MSKSQHGHKDTLIQANQNNQMSDDPRDGSRVSFTAGKDGSTPVEKKPPQDRQDEDRIEALGDDQASLADKE